MPTADGDITIDKSRVIASMNYPLDIEKQIKFWGALKKIELISEIKRLNEWPISLSEEDFAIISQDHDTENIEKEEMKIFGYGWATAMAFHFYTRAKTWSSAVKLKGNIGQLITANKMLAYIDALTGRYSFNSTIELPTSATTINTAISNLWPSAHYWATVYHPKLHGAIFWPQNPEEWRHFMKMAETYRIIGLGTNTFEFLSKQESPEDHIIFDSRITPYKFSSATMPFDKAEFDIFYSYESRKSKKRTHIKNKNSEQKK